MFKEVTQAQIDKVLVDEGVVWVIHTDGPLIISPREMDVSILSDDITTYKSQELKLEECDITNMSRLCFLGDAMSRQTHKYIETVKGAFNEN